MDFRELFLNPHGRIGRKAFWIGTLVLALISLAGGLFALFIGAPIGGRFAVEFLIGLLGLAIAGPFLSIALKRSNDRNYPPEPVLAFSSLNIALQIMGMFGLVGASPSGLYAILVVILFCGSFWMLIDLGFFRGTNGPNPHGPDPRAGT